MDSLHTTHGPVGPDPRPIVSVPSVATTQATNPKPAPQRPPRPHQHDERPGLAAGRHGLKHIVRDVRQAIHTEVQSSDLDHETLDSIRDLQKDFRRELHGVFKQAGGGDAVDRAAVLEGMIKALQDLTAGLRDINDREALPVPETVSPGTLVDLSG